MNLRPLLILTNLAFFATHIAIAADDSSSAATVDGTGNVTIKQMPDTMRMVIQFKETGKDLNAAIKNLKDRRDAAKEKLLKFGATAASVHEGATSVAGEDPQAAMMAMQMGGRKKKKKTAAKQTSVLGKILCEWPLPAGTPDEQLIFVQGVKDKVLAADLAAQKDEKKLSAEEQEEREEQEMMQQEYGGRVEAKVGEPTFTFIGRISPADQLTARTSAFKKAREQAEQLATAAGRKLGKLQTLRCSIDGISNHYSPYGVYDNDNDDSSSELSDDTDNEGISQSRALTKIAFRFIVNAAFVLE